MMPPPGGFIPGGPPRGYIPGTIECVRELAILWNMERPTVVSK